MAGSTITGTVSNEVILGGGTYDSPLTVTASGTVFLYHEMGLPAIYGAQRGDHVSNAGRITGDTGLSGFYGALNGGAGVDLTEPGTVLNNGIIFGGAGEGGTPAYGQPALGGDGVDLNGGHLFNNGLITGGAGGLAAIGHEFRGGNGGSGVSLTGSIRAINRDSIVGGAGAHYVGGGNGGTGVRFGATGSFANQGLIQGGCGDNYAQGGTGVVLSLTGTLVNGMVIDGGAGALGEILSGGGGGIGVAVTGAGRLINHGMINGGAGGQGRYSSNGGPGGAGLSASADAVLSNLGTIAGGAGGDIDAEYRAFAAGIGGVGVQLSAGAVMNNVGLILGGASGASAGEYTGRAGTYGAVVSGGATLSNAGTIMGGQGGATASTTLAGGAGGAAVELDGGTLIEAGTLLGGQGGGAPGGTGAAGDAVLFTGSGTLSLRPTAVLTGNVAADSSVNDVLALGGQVTGTLSGLGATVTGFTTITENTGAHWILSGDLAGVGTVTVGSLATLTLDSLLDAGTIAFAGSGFLKVGEPVAPSSAIAGFGAGDRIAFLGVDAVSLQFADGLLKLYGPGGHQVLKLHFVGDYNAGDFALESIGRGTELIYTGPALIHSGNGIAGFFESNRGSGLPAAFLDWHRP